MKENLPFDDFVKQQFSSYSPDVPAHIWENIRKAKRTSRPTGFWTIFTGGKIVLIALLILTGAGGYYFISGNNSSSNAPLSNTQGTDRNVNEKDNSGDLKKPGHESNVITDQKNSNSAKDQLQPPGTIMDNSTEPSNYKGNQSSKGNDRKNFINNNQFNKNNKTANDTDEQEITVTANNPGHFSTPVYSPFMMKNARELQVKKLPGSLIMKLPECPALEEDAAGNKKYWEAYLGPDYAFEVYKTYGDTASANYLEKRKASTKFASAFSAGVRYTKVFNNGTSVRAGINYSQVNEKFIYFNPNEIKFVTVITTRVVIRAPGDTIYINDTLQYQQSGTRIKTTFNRYRNIDVPLVIGYELGNGKIHANINAGVIINIYSWYKGDVLDSLYQPVTITTGKTNSIYQYKNNIGVGFLGSISLYYKITDKFHLVLEPYFRYNLSPMSKQNLNLQQKNNIGGVRTGIRMDLK